LLIHLGCKPTGSAFKGLKTAMTRARGFMLSGNMSGNLDQQGGTFIINPEGDIIYQYIDEYAGEFDDYDGIVSACQKYRNN